MSAGIWGSAFTVLLQSVLRERKLPSDTVDEMSNMGDLRDELRTSFRMLSIMPNIPVISVGSQMERSVSVWSDWSTRDHPASGGGPATLTGRTEICRSILTNRFVARHLFSRFQISRKEWKIVRAIPLSYPVQSKNVVMLSLGYSHCPLTGRSGTTESTLNLNSFKWKLCIWTIRQSEWRADSPDLRRRPSLIWNLSQ